MPKSISIPKKSFFINEQPEVINEISFTDKTCIEDHIFLCGDAAGLITPLCGNGMSMAIHGAKILSEILIDNLSRGNNINALHRLKIENEYTKIWKTAFSSRLFWGRTLQEIYGNKNLTAVSLSFIHSFPSLEKWLIKKTHGNTII